MTFINHTSRQNLLPGTTVFFSVEANFFLFKTREKLQSTAQIHVCFEMILIKTNAYNKAHSSDK